MVKRFILALLLVAILIIGVALPVFAIADPDSAPSLNAVYVYEDLLADGDVGVLTEYFLDYAVNPDETATEAYLTIFIDTDNTTQLRAVAPYTFQDDGYGLGLTWIYFTPAEVTSLGLDRSNTALYSMWLTGNPTLSWPGDPPKTTAGITEWQAIGASAATVLALRVLSYAQILQNTWSPTIIMIQETALGNRLTGEGEAYFTNVIPNLSSMAPSVFTAGEFGPTLEDLDYSTSFGATMTDLTGTVVGSPITLVEGANTVTIAANGTFTLELNKGTVGTVVDGTGVVTGSPVDIVVGTNTITTTGLGTLIVTVNLVDLTTAQDDTVVGTAFDVTAAATRFGMTRWMFSSLVWLVITIVICGIVARRAAKTTFGVGALSGKVVMLVFNICIIGGGVLGLLHPLVAILLFIGFGSFTGYVVFYRGSSA